MARKTADHAALEDRLGHAFRRADLLIAALTHVSALAASDSRSDTYQRLEFLGDRVLGLVVADLLFTRFPDAEEGELSRRLAELVRKETCADVAIGWEVGPFLRLGPGEMRTGGRRKTAILGDVCEALIGAVFVDAGFEAARAVVTRGFGPLIDGGGAARIDPKTALQEWSQAQGLGPPSYEIVARSGPDHAPNFQIAARVPGLADEIGSGRSKREGEHAAALALLLREGVWPAHAPVRSAGETD